MRGSLLIKSIVCFAAFSVYLYSVLQSQNTLNNLSYRLPKIETELRALAETNTKLSYQIETFSDPNHLTSLLKTNAYSHLRFPVRNDVLVRAEGLALKVDTPYKLKKHLVSDQEDVAIARR